MEVDQSNKKEKENTTESKSSNDINKTKDKTLNSPKKDKNESSTNQNTTTNSTANSSTTPSTTNTTSTKDNSNKPNNSATSTAPSTNSKHVDSSSKKISETDAKNSSSSGVKSSIVSPKTSTNDVTMTDANDNNKKSIDREKVCPFLIRVFCKKGVHHRIEDFSTTRQPTEDEIQIYTWKDASLRELASLLAEIDPKYSQHGSSISFKAIYLDGTRGRFQSKDLGVINISKSSKTDTVTLEENRFIIGDYLDVALQTYSDVRRNGSYSYERSENTGGGFGGGNRIGGNTGGRFGGGGVRNNGGNGMGFNNNRQRKDRIGERRELFSSRSFNNNQRDDRRGNFRSDRLR